MGQTLLTDLSQMRALVIGGGLIGGYSAVALAARGAQVVVYSRTFSPWLLQQEAVGSRIQLVSGGLDTAELLQHHVSQADAVALLAGTSTPSLSDGDTTAAVLGSLVPALNVLDAMRRCDTEKLVMASSGGTIYGPVDVLPTPEEHAKRPVSLHGVNAEVVEEYARYFEREHGIQPVSLRFSNVYGPGQYVRGGQGVIAAWCGSIAQGQPIDVIGDGSIKRDFIFAADAARAVVAGLAADIAGSYNVGSGTSHTLEQVRELLIKASGRECKINRLPARRVDVPETMLDCSRFEALTGWEPGVSLDRGLVETWNWYRDHGPASGSSLESYQRT